MKKVIPSDAILVPDNAELKFHGMIFDVYQWPQKLFDGSEHTFEMLKRTDTVNAICIVGDKILVIDDEQPHMGSRQSFPGGRVDPEDPDLESAAKREILEETGYSFKNWRLVKVIQPLRKAEWFVYTYLAWEPESKQDTKLDPGESITVKELGFGRLKQLIATDADYLGESRDIFSEAEDTQQLLKLPEFNGKSIEI